MTKQSNRAIAPVSFDFNSNIIRAVSDDKGNPWFLANDVCAVLGYANPRKTIGDHCREGGVTKRDTPTSSGLQVMTFINEGNLYRLIVKSRKPEAEPFENWVMDEVLPTIRKTGRYAKPRNALKDLRSRKALPGGLTLEQQDAIKALVKSRVDALPEDRRAKAAITCWSALKSKFGCSYKLIPPAQFGEALSLIARLDLGDASQDLLGAMRLANSPGALAGRRFLIRFSPGGDHYTASPVPEQAAVLTLRGFLRAVADPNGLLFPMDDTDLMFDAVESLQRMLRLRHAYFNRIGRA